MNLATPARLSHSGGETRNPRNGHLNIFRVTPCLRGYLNQIYMRIILTLLAGLFVNFYLSAQNIAVNNDGSLPSASAMLDVKSNNKGLLIPRVALTSINDYTTIASPSESLLIYNTSTISGLNEVLPGYYYWHGALGWVRLIFEYSGSYNTAFGFQALPSYSSSFNTAIGYQALYSTNVGGDNTATGFKALYSNTTGSTNVATGYSALYSNTTGYHNIATGYSALLSNTSGDRNTATGFQSLFLNTQGRGNTAYGFWSLRSNNLGNANTGIGENAQYNNTGDSNTALGVRALYSNTNGSYNTAVGADADVTSPGFTNATVIGASAKVSCSNCLVLGNNANVGIRTSNPGFPLNFSNDLGDKISFYGTSGNHYGIGVQSGLLQIHSDVPGTNIVFGYGSSSSFSENMRIKGNGDVVVKGTVTANGVLLTSDSRFKKNITSINNVLTKITQLNAYHYYWKDDQNDPSLQTGVLAQEVEKVFPELVKKNENGYLSVNYSGLIPVLIESTKEQQKQITIQQQQIQELRDELKQLKKLIQQTR